MNFNFDKNFIFHLTITLLAIFWAITFAKTDLTIEKITLLIKLAFMALCLKVAFDNGKKLFL